MFTCSVADREKALSRSLRIFGVTFQGRACPTVDEYTKCVLFVGGLPQHTTQEVQERPITLFPLSLQCAVDCADGVALARESCRRGAHEVNFTRALLQ